MPTDTDFITLHIALATYPKGKSKKYVESIENYYSNFKKNIKKFYSNNPNVTDKQLEGLYEPLTYHIFGSFDVAFISLIDNYKFTQKIFFPEDSENGGDSLETNSYQVLTGIFPGKNTREIRSDIHRLGQKLFVSITNLKLSNGFLVGNGLDYLDIAISAVEEKLKARNVECVFLQSFSWFEITVVIFLEDISQIGDIVGEIRDISLAQLDDADAQKIVEESFYSTFWPQKSLKNFYLFSDSQSYLGVRFSEYASFGKEAEFRKINLRTQVEWQVKPGQLGNLIQDLRGLNLNKTLEEEQPVYALSGKSDYWIKEVDGNLEHNYKLFQHAMPTTSTPGSPLTGSEQNIRAHIRNYKTRLLINFDVLNKPPSPKLDGAFKNPIGEKLYFHSEDIRLTYCQLKSLKISRHIRQKISKIFFNYNSGIQDPVLSIFFYDFYNFLHHLRNLINEEYSCFHGAFINGNHPISDPKKSNQSLKSVHEIEKILEEFIQAFEEGYHIRTLNCYQFEEIYDFDLDLNSSIPQLLTTYNTMVMDIADHLHAKKAYRIQFRNEFAGAEHVYGHKQLVQLNLRNTVSTTIGINYNVYHLTNPEFIFFTIGKEILNSFARTEELNATSNQTTNTLPSFIQGLDDRLKNSNVNYIKSLEKDGLLVSQSYIIDAIQLIFICKSDLRLFEYWFWMYNFQHTSMYSTTGVFDEIHFKKELFRLIFLARLQNQNEPSLLSCPIYEVASFWHRYYADTKRAVEAFFEDNKSFLDLIPGGVNGLLSIDKTYDRSLDDFYQEKFVSNPTRVFRKNETDNNMLFLRKVMYSYLRWIFEKNKRKVAILHRDWETGRPLERFIQNTADSDRLFLVDPLGGLFFTDTIREKEYYAVQNAILKSLWNYAMLSKRDFLNFICQDDLKKANT